LRYAHQLAFAKLRCIISLLSASNAVPPLVKTHLKLRLHTKDMHACCTLAQHVLLCWCMPREHQSQNYFLPMLPVRHYSVTGNCITHYKSLVPLQGIGITVPGSGITISKTAVRGVDSFGMLCSAHDIGWSDKADGVLVVMPDESQPGDACPADPPKVAYHFLGD